MDKCCVNCEAWKPLIRNEGYGECKNLMLQGPEWDFVFSSRITREKGLKTPRWFSCCKFQEIEDFLPPEKGGCWFCSRGNGVLLRTDEWDGYFHLQCMLDRLPYGEEAQVLAKEFGLDEKWRGDF